MSLFLPFNQRPSSTTVRTSSYTIPAGKYARVTVYVEKGGSFTIDGGVALNSEAASAPIAIAVSDSGSYGVNASYTVPSGYIFEGQATASGSNITVKVGGLNAQYGNASDSAPSAQQVPNIKAGPGQLVEATSNNTLVTLTGYARKVSNENTSNSEEFWLNSGVTISGSGTWRATVEEYDIT